MRVFSVGVAVLSLCAAAAAASTSTSFVVPTTTLAAQTANNTSAASSLISQLQYIEQTYFVSKAYMTMGGQPVVTNFGIDDSYTIDWNAVNSALPTKPLFLFQNNGGFTHTLTNGSYSWVMPTTTDFGMSYMTSFYNTGIPLPIEQTVGAT